MTGFSHRTQGNLYLQQEHNRSVTVGLSVAFAFLLLALGAFFDCFLMGSNLGWAVLSAPYLPITAVMFFSSLRRIGTRIASLWGRKGDSDDDHDEAHVAEFFLVVVGTTMLFAFYYTAVYMPAWRESAFQGNGSLNRTFSIPYVLPYGSLLALCVAGLVLFWSRRGGAESLLSLTLAEEVSREGEQERELRDVVEEMSLAAGIPIPVVYIVCDADPNAYSLGVSMGSSSVIVTDGLLHVVNREELQAVVAHEIAHIRSGDTKVLTTIALLFGMIVLLADWSRQRMLFGGAWKAMGSAVRRGFWGIVGLIVWLSTVLFAGIIARMLALAVSRTREYLADATAAELTRNPLALASALAKIENAAGPTMSVNRGVGYLCIVDPMGSRWNQVEGFWADLFATHPPMAKRIARLREMGYLTAEILGSPARISG